MAGSFSPSGCPVVPIKLWGFHPNFSRDFDAIIDTGFTGFLALPLAHAFRIGLILHSTASFSLADGSVEHTLLCMGTVLIEGHEIIGLISISKGKEVLIGTELLKKLNKKLTLDFQNSQIEFH